MSDIPELKKNDVCLKMLSSALSHIRNVQSRGERERKKDRACYFESELVHNLMHTLLSPEFREHDIWFMNNQAKFYYENCSPEISINYGQQSEYIKMLFLMVPDELKHTLIWQGPA